MPGPFRPNLLATVPKGHQEMVAAAFRTIFAQVTPAEIAAQWDHVRDMLIERFAKAARLMDGAKEEVLAFRAFPRAHWRQLCLPTHSSGSTKSSSAGTG